MCGRIMVFRYFSSERTGKLVGDGGKYSATQEENPLKVAGDRGSPSRRTTTQNGASRAAAE